MKKILVIICAILGTVGSIAYYYAGLRLSLFHQFVSNPIFESKLYSWGMTAAAISLGILLLIPDKKNSVKHPIEKAGSILYLGGGLIMFVCLLM